MNCLKVDPHQGDRTALEDPSMMSSSTATASMSMTPSSVSGNGGNGRNIRSWSSSHVDSVGESTHSKNSLVRNQGVPVSRKLAYSQNL